MRHNINIEPSPKTVGAYAELVHPSGKWYRIWVKRGSSGYYVHSDFGHQKYTVPVEGCAFWERPYGVWSSSRYESIAGATHEMEITVLSKLDSGYQVVRSGTVEEDHT